jgi:hypothetical protein
MPPRRPPLTVAQVLAWADRHHARTGRWPITTSGPVLDHPGEKWVRIDAALRRGLGGLPGGDSLARLLDRRRGVRNVRGLPPLTEGVILAWADRHRRRTGWWPRIDSGPVAGAPGETLAPNGFFAVSRELSDATPARSASEGQANPSLALRAGVGCHG